MLSGMSKSKIKIFGSIYHAFLQCNCFMTPCQLPLYGLIRQTLHSICYRHHNSQRWHHDLPSAFTHSDTHTQNKQTHMHAFTHLWTKTVLETGMHPFQTFLQRRLGKYLPTCCFKSHLGYCTSA